jgi:alpha-mannosidase
MQRFFAVTSFFGFMAVLFAATASGQATTLWQIGKRDHSDFEFHAPQQAHLVYEPDKNDWARDWPAMEAVGATYEIRFPLSSAPRGAYTLTVSLLAGDQETPDLQIAVNGHKGIYFVRTQPLYILGGGGSTQALLTIELPTQYLVKGSNSLVLTPVFAPASKAEAPAAGSLRYDYVCLSNDPNAHYDRRAVHADVVPTVFYRRAEGNLVEIVDAYVRFNQAIPAGHGELILNGNSYRVEIAPRDGFGEERLEFEIPEWTGPAPARLALDAAGRHSFNLSLIPQRKWTVFVVPHTHVDIGYTDYQGKVAEQQAQTLLEAAKLIKEHPEFRFATDGSWNLQQLMETRSQPDRDEVLNLIHEDKIGLPADYFNLLTGYASLESLYRSLYYTKSLSREYHLPFDYATTTDVPSYTGAYPSVLASAGIHYWAVGANQDRAPVLEHERWNEKSPFWWQGPDGEKVLFWYSDGYSEIWRFFTTEPTNARIYSALPTFLAPFEKPEYKPDAVLMYGAQFENTALHPQLATFVDTWNQAYAYPRLQYATFADFFRYIDARFGSALQTYKGDMGPYWEDGIGADAYYAAIDRQNQSNALSAETLSSMAHTLNPDYHPPRPELQDAWNNILLFAEHTWGAGNSVSQPDSEQASGQLAVKDNFATQAHFELNDVRERAIANLASKIGVPVSTFIVFNSLNWKRNALVQMDLEKNQKLVDLSNNQDVPVELMWQKENFFHVRFLAGNLPAVGYKCFAIESAPGTTPENGEVSTNPVIENQYYRITVDPQSGAVQSIFDKQVGKELVAADNPYKFGQYLYVTGGNDFTSMVHPYPSYPKVQLGVHPATDGKYLGATKTPWGYKIDLRSSDLNTPGIGLGILLFNDEKKIEFDYTIDKTYITSKEAVYFAFPTAVEQPHFAYGIQQGWLDPAHDLLKGASLEWFTIQKWMAVHDTGLSVEIVPIDAPLASFGDINRGLWPAEFHPRSSTLFSYAMNNYWHTNYRAGQGGRFTFRYVMTSSDSFDPAALSRLGWQSMEAPVTGWVASHEKVEGSEAPLPASGTSFLEIDNPNVALVTWKLAEDGNGTILRLKEIAGQAEEVNVGFPHAIARSAILCNSVEDDLHTLPVSANRIHVALRPNEVVTLRVDLQSAD